MPWTVPAIASAPPFQEPTSWAWLLVSIIPDIVLVASLIGLWRRYVSSQTRSGRRLAAARTELTRSAEALWLATELADVGVWHWDLSSGTLTWSDRCKAHFGMPTSQAVTIDSFYAALHPDDRERVRAAIERSRSERVEFRTTYRAMLPDGTQRELAAMGRFTFDAHGKPLSMGGVTLDVTRIRQLESELRSAEVASVANAAELSIARRLRIVAENASDVVMEIDNDGVVRWVTPTVALRLGCRPEEVVGSRYTRQVHPDDLDHVRTMERQVQQGMAADGEVRLRLSDGSYRWFMLSLRPIFDDRHAVVRRVGGWRDIHGEVLAREAAATERQRLRAQMTSMIHPIVLGQPVHDAAGEVVDFTYADVNQAACEFIGIDRERLLGRRLLDLFPQLKTSGLFARFAVTAETGRPTMVNDFPFPLAGGEVRWMDVRAVRADGWVSFAWRDNTDNRRAMEKIAASEEQFRLLAENSLDVVVRLDANDKVVWVSPSVKSVLGWDVAECIGKSGLEFLATEETRRQYRRDKARVFAGEGAVSRSQVRSASGTVHWMEAHSSPFRMPDGRIDGVIAALRVIDAEVEAEQALERRARTDDLTQLVNRKELMDRLAGMLDGGESDFAVLWCDIDRFKATNDSRGHAAGDAVLEALGERIRGCLPKPDDLGARVGGDELLVVLRGVHDLDAATQLAERLRRAAAEPIPFAGGAVAVTLSIGVTLARADEGVDATLARADDAMYRAKEQGRNRVVAVAAPPAAAEPRLASAG
jgi:diguanylate cyclase (GGDEF)-like protein/PAS domain S-box-containing protein